MSDVCSSDLSGATVFDRPGSARARYRFRPAFTHCRARRRRTVPAAQLQLFDQGETGHVYGYSFIVTDKEGAAADVEYWQRHRTVIEERYRDLKLGCGLLHLPLGTLDANRGWLVATVLASNLMAMLSDTVMRTSPKNVTPAESRNACSPRFRTTGTLRRWLILVPGRVVRSGRRWTLRLPRSALWAREFENAYRWLAAFQPA